MSSLFKVSNVSKDLKLICIDKKSLIFDSTVFSLMSDTYKRYISYKDYKTYVEIKDGKIIYYLDFDYNILTMIMNFYSKEELKYTTKNYELFEMLRISMDYDFILLKKHIKTLITNDIDNISILLLKTTIYRSVFMKSFNNYDELKQLYLTCCETSIQYYYYNKNMAIYKKGFEYDSYKKNEYCEYKKEFVLMMGTFNKYFTNKQINEWLIKHS